MHSTDIVCHSDMTRQTNLSQSNLKLFENFLEQTNLQNNCWSRSLSALMLSNALVKSTKSFFKMSLNLFCVCFPAKVKFTNALCGLKPPLIHFFFQFLRVRLCQAVGIHRWADSPGCKEPTLAQRVSPLGLCF